MIKRILFPLSLLLFLSACGDEDKKTYPQRIISIPADSAAVVAENIRGSVSAALLDGIKLDVWASDTLVHDPIAISIDEQGRIFYTQAKRQANSEFDIRSHRNWMTASISFQTIEDRSEFLKKTFSQTNEEGERFLLDLNGDSVLNWLDLAVEKEQVWMVSDESGDGVADRSQLYIEDFNEEITDVANGVEVHNGEVFIAVGPDFWRTSDTDGDGIADKTKSLSRGYAIHIGFSGHGMSGAKIGPDGRIWWGIGDIGMNVVDQEGNHWKYPNQGVIVRSELDGSNFEVYSAGLRNTHEFTFDKYGNLITEDNDGDHRGERERLVHLINGSDGGWRTNWQFGKYTDPDNNRYKVWMDEGMHKPRWEGQPEYILPPIMNYVNGPTGFVYNPGTALNDDWKEFFFVSEFRGSPANSPIHAFRLKPKGASFEMDTTVILAQGLLPTGLDFGPDGALYFGDWIDGWGTKKAGRIWRLDVDNPSTEKRREVESLIRSDFSESSAEELAGLLGHEDMRIRQKAQFELVDRRDDGFEALESALEKGTHMARIHAVWGIAQLARTENMSYAEGLTELLNDDDEEVMTQAIRMLGDIRYNEAAELIQAKLSNPSPRVQLITIEALGRLSYEPALEAVLQVLEQNNDNDTWIRHAGMIALARFGNEIALAELSNHPSRPLRIAAVVALRRMKSPEVARFLSDTDEGVATDAARAINDDYSIPEALPALASSLTTTELRNEAYIRRAINANLRVDGNESIDNLVEFASKSSDDAMVAEILEVLRTWGKPSVLDRVDGRNRGLNERDPSYARAKLGGLATKVFESDLTQSKSAALKAIGQYGLTDFVETAVSLLKSSSDAGIRNAALQSLSSIDKESMVSHLDVAFNDDSEVVRASAMSLLAETDMSEPEMLKLFENVLDRGTIGEKQAVLASLAKMSSDESVNQLGSILNQLADGSIEKEIGLDVFEAVQERGDEALVARLGDIESLQGEAAFNLTLYGGNRRAGMDLFYNHEAAQCVRCHSIFERGGNAGPVLADVGAKLSRELLMESIVWPSKSYALGYEISRITLETDENIIGTVVEEDDTTVTLRMANEDTRDVPKSTIKERVAVPSAMPPMEHILTKREIRDLVEFLSALKE